MDMHIAYTVVYLLRCPWSLVPEAIALTEAGYDGAALQALVAIKSAERRMTPITERMLRKWIELLACANTHSKKLFATGGSHVCSDVFF